MPFQQGEIIQNLSLGRIKTLAIPGANHVTYTHNGGVDFSEVRMVCYVLDAIVWHEHTSVKGCERDF